MAFQIILEYFSISSFEKIIPELLATVLLIITIPYMLRHSNKTSIKSDLELAKIPNKRRFNLFTSLGDPFDTDAYIYLVFENSIDESDYLENLNLCKSKVREKIGEEIEDYILLKSAIDIQLKTGLLNFFSGIAKTILVSIVTVIFTSFFITKAADVYLKSGSVIDLTLILIKCLNFILVLLVMLTFIFDVFGRRNKRAILFQIIIDSIIRDLEKKDNT